VISHCSLSVYPCAQVNTNCWNNFIYLELLAQVLRSVEYKDGCVHSSHFDDSFLADIPYSMAQGQAVVNDDELTEVLQTSDTDLRLAPLFDGPSTSKGTSHAAAFGGNITSSFLWNSG
jgi:hypothetical protein